MKKKTSWKTFTALALAAGTWLKLAGDFPISPLITPPQPPDPELPGRFTECPEGFYRKLIEGQWRCWPRYDPPKLYPYGIGKYTSLKPPTCRPFETAKYDEKLGRWYCVPRGLL